MVVNQVFDLIDLRKVWVHTIKTNKEGNFLKAKAKWVLKDFHDKQAKKKYLQTDSPASTRPGFRMSCQMAAKQGWLLFHLDLKTSILQGQSYTFSRVVACQLPPETGHPQYILLLD